MTDNQSDFWGAVAQLIPVLAIPLVIEARTLARRISATADEFKQRAVRARWGITYTVVGGNMVSTELIALGNLAGSESATWQVIYALCVLLVAFYVVFSIPVAEIAEALLRDTLWLVSLRAPWGKVKRMRRVARRALRKVRVLRSQARKQEKTFLPLVERIAREADPDKMLREFHAHVAATAQQSTPAGRKARKSLADDAILFGEGNLPTLAGLRNAFAERFTRYDEIEANALEVIAKIDRLMGEESFEEAVEALRRQVASLADAERDG